MAVPGRIPFLLLRLGQAIQADFPFQDDLQDQLHDFRILHCLGKKEAVQKRQVA